MPLKSREGHPALLPGGEKPPGCTHGGERGAGAAPCQGSPIATPMSLVSRRVEGGFLALLTMVVVL